MQTLVEGLSGFPDCKGVLRQKVWEPLIYSKLREFSQMASALKDDCLLFLIQGSNYLP